MSIWDDPNLSKFMTEDELVDATISYETKRDEHLRINPSWTDSRFKKPRTVYLEAGYKLKDTYVKKAEYNYSDRLMEWHGHSKAHSIIESIGGLRTAEDIEKYLSALLEKPNLRLVHVKAGVNLWNGFAYQVFGYFPEEVKK